MNPHELTVGLSIGCVLLALGLIPRLFDALTERVTEGLRNFRGSFLFGMPLFPPRRAERERPHRPFWLAGAGALLITITVLNALRG